ncbi:hypothetical protein [Actinomycetospora cinnamomea]|uniref:hypothetical protein n=1 Tax=Actinomycetospora cinnamomea TaxID=663609 RepID=UPI000E320350|nr:hypothetical protein [Actinomycetospora cinnamomea]
MFEYEHESLPKENVMSDRPRVDPSLTLMVQSVNKMESSASAAITLTLPGLIVTGTIVPAHQWFEEQGQQLGPRNDAGDPNWLVDEAADLRKLRDELATVESKLDELGDEASRTMTELHRATEPEYIHLREARILTGFSMAPGEGMYWRGRLADVIGWTAGSLVLNRDVRAAA